jgi:hypothetical protein
MNNRVRIIFSAMMVLLLALISAFSVIPARADDGAPPPPAAPASPAKAATIAPSGVSNVPAGTDLVVVNRSGRKVALATQEAAKIVEEGDPIWCPAGVVPGGATCSSPLGNTSLDNVFSWLNTNNPAKAGVIWIDKGYDSSINDPGITSFVLDGSSLAMGNYTLTINGGWNGTGTGMDPLSPSILNYASLDLYNWNNTITLNNITIANAPDTGLYITSKKNIVLNNFDAYHNAGEGAYLDNCYSQGAGCTGTGTIAVNFGTFNDNDSNGFRAFSSHAITVKNIAADGNTLDGAYLDNSNATTAQPVTMTGVNNFNFNSFSGLEIYSRGAITVGNVTAIYNKFGNGAYLDNCRYNTGAEWCEVLGANNITLKGSNNFSDNGLDGVEAWASGAIAANNLTANFNGTALAVDTTNLLSYEYGAGAYLDNYGAPTPKPLTLTGTNSFTGNGSTGLWLDSYGAVTVSNLTANGNGQDVNCQPSWICDGTHVDGSTTFTLTGYGTFNGNGDDGLDAWSWGAITATNLSADGNNWWGVGFYNDNTDSNSNPHAANITLGGTNVFTNNGATGLWLESYGTITTNNVTASYNGMLQADTTDGYGAMIDNCIYDSGTQTCETVVPKNVTLNGINTFNGNYADGLDVISLGTITAKQVTANNNGLEGAYLDNQWGFKNYNVTLSGTNVFNDNNGGIGLEVYSNGNIVMSNLTANGNFGAAAGSGNVYDGGGAYLDNWTTTLTPVFVTLTGTNTFNGNGNYDGVYYNGSGLVVNSDGAITISNLSATDNFENGAYLDNSSYGWLPRNITLTGANTFVDNGTDGLNYSSIGGFSATQVNSEWNGRDGMYGDAATTTLVTCGNMYLNGDYGYNLTSIGTITLKGVYSYDNTGPDTWTSHSAVVTYACPIP